VAKTIIAIQAQEAKEAGPSTLSGPERSNCSSPSAQ